MEEINRLHDIADDIASTSWGYELASALHHIAAGIGEKVDGMRRVGEYEDDVLTFVEAYGGLEEVKAHMIPEGFRWPVFEDNEPVRLGDHWFVDGFDASITRVDSIRFDKDGVFLENEYNDIFYRHGERVKRLDIKVLDADGVEIRVGDAVYHEVDGTKLLVLGFLHEEDGERLVKVKRITGPTEWSSCRNLSLTHRAPVLAADGKPIREGEHVYHVETGVELVVKELPKPEAYQAVVAFAPPASHLTSFDPDRLTHERPDSYERLWMDMHPADETECVGLDRDEFVRRAKAIAERWQ